MAEQESKGRIAAFNFSLSACDAEVAEWFLKQPNKGAYLKSLILADKENCNGNAIVSTPTKHDREWESHYELLKDFCEEYGRLPAYAEVYKEFRIGRWLHDTLRRSRESRPDRMEKLQSLGVYDKWERNLELVKRFRAVYGRFPRRSETFEGVNIGTWFSAQMSRLRKDSQSFSHERLEQFAAIGVCPSDWDRKFGVLETFVAEHGRLPKYTEVYQNVRIGRWTAYQRKSLDPIKQPVRYEKFEKLGIVSLLPSSVGKVKTKI